MHPNDILDFNVKPYTEEDRTLALEFHSGNTSHKCFANNPKYQEEGIISSILLPNSVVQLGFNWVRYIPISEPESSSLEASDSLVIASICNIFSKAITRSLKEKSTNVTGILKGLGTADKFKDESFDAYQSSQVYPEISGSALSQSTGHSLPANIKEQGTSLYPSGLNLETQSGDTNGSSTIDGTKTSDFSNKLNSFGDSASTPISQSKLAHDAGSSGSADSVSKKPKFFSEEGDKSLVKLSALTSLSYPVGFKEPLPDAIAHPFWDSDVLDPPNKMERKLLCLIMQLFKASRTPSIVSDPCFDETLTAEVQISKYLSLLVELHTRGFHSLQRGDRALCNQSLWAVGMVLRRISPLKKKELREQFPILKPPPSLRLFANVLRSASRFAQAWETGTSSAPFSRISHIDCDMLRTMCTLSLPDFYTLQKALLKLHENY